jgi:uncharacterized protein
VDEHVNVKVVREAFEAFEAGDLDALAGALHEDVVWHVPGTNRFSGRFEGRDAVIDRLRRMHEAGLQTTLDAHDVLGNDEHVVALVRLGVRNADGQAYEQSQVQVWHMRDGRCEEYWAMNEDQAVLDVLLG